MTESEASSRNVAARPRLVAPLILCWLLLAIAGGLVGFYLLPRCAEDLPPGLPVVAILAAALAGWLGWRRSMRPVWLVLLAAIYGGLTWFGGAFGVAAGNVLASGLCRLFRAAGPLRSAAGPRAEPGRARIRGVRGYA